MTIYMTSQAPHAHRTLFAIVSGLPEHQIRIISPDIGGGFGNKVPIYPGYVCATVASLIIGRPVKWMESRSDNLMSSSFARDYRMTGEIAATSDGEILGVRSTILADHGAFDAHAQPGEQYPTGFFPIFTSCYDVPAAYAEATGRLLEQSPRRHRLPLLVPGHRGHLPHGTHDGRARRRARHGPGRAQAQELRQEGADALRLRHGLGVRRRRLRGGAG